MQAWKHIVVGLFFGAFFAIDSHATSVQKMKPESNSLSCASHARDLEELPRLKAIVDSLGGIQAVQGAWQFSGVGPFRIGKTNVIFQSRAEGFVSRQDNKPFRRIRICESDQGPDVIRIVSEGSEDNAKTHVLIRKGSNGALDFAAVESKWKFYSFFPVRSDAGGIAQNTHVTAPISSVETAD